MVNLFAMAKPLPGKKKASRKLTAGGHIYVQLNRVRQERDALAEQTLRLTLELTQAKRRIQQLERDLEWEKARPR